MDFLFAFCLLRCSFYVFTFYWVLFSQFQCATFYALLCNITQNIVMEINKKNYSPISTFSPDCN